MSKYWNVQEPTNSSSTELHTRTAMMGQSIIMHVCTFSIFCEKGTSPVVKVSCGQVACQVLHQYLIVLLVSWCEQIPTMGLQRATTEGKEYFSAKMNILSSGTQKVLVSLTCSAVTLSSLKSFLSQDMTFPCQTDCPFK